MHRFDAATCNLQSHSNKYRYKHERTETTHEVRWLCDHFSASIIEPLSEICNFFFVVGRLVRSLPFSLCLYLSLFFSTFNRIILKWLKDKAFDMEHEQKMSCWFELINGCSVRFVYSGSQLFSPQIIRRVKARQRLIFHGAGPFCKISGLHTRALITKFINTKKKTDLSLMMLSHLMETVSQQTVHHLNLVLKKMNVGFSIRFVLAFKTCSRKRSSKAKLFKWFSYSYKKITRKLQLKSGQFGKPCAYKFHISIFQHRCTKQP